MAYLGSSLFKRTPLGLSPYSLSPLLALGNQNLAYTHSNSPLQNQKNKTPTFSMRSHYLVISVLVLPYTFSWSIISLEQFEMFYWPIESVIQYLLTSSKPNGSMALSK